MKIVVGCNWLGPALSVVNELTKIVLGEERQVYYKKYEDMKIRCKRATGKDGIYRIMGLLGQMIVLF